jgi:hypothetical protein
MGIPQVPHQVRRAPTLALRAVFSGIGRILLSADRPGANAAALVAAAQLAPDAADGVAPGAPALAASASVADRAADATAQVLPLIQYDSLSLGSLRARLRGLDVAQLRVLLDYERRNAERPEVLGMFERRIEKLESGA